MSNIQTIKAEAEASGSQNSAEWILNVDIQTESPDCACHETVQMLYKKIDELVDEVNTLKNQ